MSEDLRIVTKEALINAIKNAKISADPATDAESLLNFFGFEDRIIDNLLTSDDREMFYILEQEGLLKADGEDDYTITGKPWEIHYWRWNKNKIFESPIKPVILKEVELYNSLPEVAWIRAGESC